MLYYDCYIWLDVWLLWFVVLFDGGFYGFGFFIRCVIFCCFVWCVFDLWVLFMFVVWVWCDVFYCWCVFLLWMGWYLVMNFMCWCEYRFVLLDVEFLGDVVWFLVVCLCCDVLCDFYCVLVVSVCVWFWLGWCCFLLVLLYV